MSLITYTLLIGFHFGIKTDQSTENFDPEILGQQINKIMFWFIEAIFIKIGFYVLGVENAPFLALLCITGYKFV